MHVGIWWDMYNHAAYYFIVQVGTQTYNISMTIDNYLLFSVFARSSLCLNYLRYLYSNENNRNEAIKVKYFGSVDRVTTSEYLY